MALLATFGGCHAIRHVRVHFRQTMHEQLSGAGFAGRTQGMTLPLQVADLLTDVVRHDRNQYVAQESVEVS
jgi:uncharacterized lipoprotein YajG